MAEREAIPEDFNFDPSFSRQRRLAKHLLGIALNRYPRERPEAGLFERHQPATRQELVDVAIREGLVEYTPWHHAPCCPANDWSKQQLPEGPCTCGAERAQIRLRDR